MTELEASQVLLNLGKLYTELYEAGNHLLANKVAKKIDKILELI